MPHYYLHLFSVTECFNSCCFPDGPPDRRRLGEAPYEIVGPFNVSLSRLERQVKAAGFTRPDPERPQWFDEDYTTSLTICEVRTCSIVAAKQWLDWQCDSHTRRMSYRAKLRGMKEGDPYPEW